MPTKPKTNQPETPKEVQGRDTFQTPNYATELLIPFIPKDTKFIWEPACGDFKISTVLCHHGYEVITTDLKYGDDFLQSYQLPIAVKAIITNPPYSLKQKFYQKCRQYKIPFALLIPADYYGWIIQALMDGCEKIIPTRRIDYITPNGKDGKNSTSQFHTMWLTWGFNLGKSETFVELTKEMKSNI